MPTLGRQTDRQTRTVWAEAGKGRMQETSWIRSTMRWPSVRNKEDGLLGRESPLERNRRTGGGEQMGPGQAFWPRSLGSRTSPILCPLIEPRSVPSPHGPPPLRRTRSCAPGWTGMAGSKSEAGLALPAVSASGPLPGLAYVSWTAGGAEGRVRQQPDSAGGCCRWPSLHLQAPAFLGTPPT